MASKVNWYGKELINKIRAKNEGIIKEACIMVVRDAMILVRVKWGHLRASITFEVIIITRKIIGRVGSNKAYARRIELGFTGVDSLGRKYNQAPLPYLRPALHKNEKKILALFKKII